MICELLGKFKIIPAIVATLMLGFFSLPGAHPENTSEVSTEEKARQRMLRREAANSLWRLKRSLEKDGFYSARIALNVWRSTAEEAGTFDQVQYDEFKQQLYEKSVNDSLRCFEEFLLQKYFYDANICLQTWRMHSKELGTYDQTEYEALQEQLADVKKGKSSRKAKK